MTGATLFSGIGAPEVAMPSWRWLWHAEIEKFPSAVLAWRKPESQNLGDVTAHDFIDRALAIGRPDVLVFGSPCQSYSVAGKRLGLDDPRGNLALVALGIVDRLRPTWFVFENVPGLLSSYSGSDETAREVLEGPVGTDAEGDEDSDVAAFVAATARIGYFGAWTVLDAQFAGLAQRRDRLFFVGHLGAEWQRAAAVLLEPEGVCGHPPTRRQAGEKAAPTLRAGPTSGGRKYGTCADSVESLIAGTLKSNSGGGGFGSDPSETFVPVVSPAMKARDAKGASSDGDGDGDGLPLVVTHSLRADGFDASEDGTGRGTPIVPVAFAHQDGGVQTTLGYQPESGTSPALSVGQTPAIAFTAKDYGADAIEELSPTLRSGGHDQSHANGGVMPAVSVAGVRRLMPIECERLQGFPDGYTAITYRGKPAADGPRYKAIGNSMAVPVVRWILERLERVHAIRPVAQQEVA